MIADSKYVIIHGGCHEDVFVETLNFEMIDCSMFKVIQWDWHASVDVIYIMKSGVKQIHRNKGSKEQLIQEANAQIFAFGSYWPGAMFSTQTRYGNKYTRLSKVGD